jgi:hypothetical protein
VVRLDLSGAPEVLTILSGRESAVRRLDLLREAVGDEPADCSLADRTFVAGHASPRKTAASPPGRRPNEPAAVSAGPRRRRQRWVVREPHRASTARRAPPRRHAFGRLFGSNGALLPALTILLTLYVGVLRFLADHPGAAALAYRR